MIIIENIQFFIVISEQKSYIDSIQGFSQFVSGNKMIA
jgi:hypothetical protein